MIQSWRVLQTSPWNSPTPVYILATTRADGAPRTLAYTLDVRILRAADLVERELGASVLEKYESISEIVEGLVVFEDQENAAIFMHLADDIDAVISVNGPDAVNSMYHADGVVVLVDDPVVPAYLQERLLSIAYKLE